jgi:hypothetical protein
VSRSSSAVSSGSVSSGTAVACPSHLVGKLTRMSPETASPVPSKPALVTGYRAVTGVLALLVLVQAFLGGRILSEGVSPTVHAIVGNLAFALAVAALVLSIVTRLPQIHLIVSIVLAVLLTAQIGIGYTIDFPNDAGDWHVPIAMLIFGASVYQQALLRRLRTVE